MLSASLVPAWAADHGKMDERLQSATDVINEVMATPDRAIPRQILSGASCVAVIPSFKKGAFVVGAQYGQGVATCRTGHGWSAPAFVKLEGGSYGFQIGGQATDLVLVAMNQNGMEHMLHNKFKLGADAAASAGPVGRNAQAGTDWKLNAEFLTYSRSKGLFAGLDLSGDVLEANDDDMKAFYGPGVNYEAVLHGDVSTPDEARPFVRTVARYFVSTQ
ncbi:MAG TPA: lipid-binding SYLF domain-containing protein [Acidobacteriaceae bacterium]|nr:lipid-binding SYLF domain-containing protein [Acidobacteriaceae bacterium]